jgi:hypothetical protein
MKVPRLSRYWQYWGALVLLLICSIVMIGAANWSHSMKKRMGLGFSDDVVNPITALCLARDVTSFQEVLGIGLDGTVAGAPVPDIEKDVNSAIHVLYVDYLFLVLYVLVFWRLAQYFHHFGVIHRKEKALMVVLMTLPLATAVADIAENSLALAVLHPIHNTIEGQARNVTPPALAGIDAAQTWKNLREKSRVLLMPHSEDKITLIKSAGFEGVDTLTLNRMQQEPNFADAKKLLSAVYTVKEVKVSVIEEIRNACEEPSPMMYFSSKAKWICSSVLIILLGALMIRPRGAVRRKPGLDWCLGGLLMLTGGVLGLFGTFFHPVCLQPGLLFTVAAFVPLFIGGLRRFMICTTGTLR